MITIQEFKKLNWDSKKKFLEQIMLTFIEKDWSDNWSLERIIFQTSEEELDEFYEALIDSSKKEEYITNKSEEIENNNNYIMFLNNLMNQNINKLEEYKDKGKDWDIDDLLNNMY